MEPESIARLIDAFVNSFDLTKYGVKEAAKEGRPSYDPKGMYKLYIYGSRKGIHSSRKLAESCRVNLEVKWMLGGVEPDFHTISDFRKDNIDSLKEIFHEFNKRISGAVEWGFSSIDGSKFLANNSKDNNFTKNKLDGRIKWLNTYTEEYLRILKDMDEQEDEMEEADKLTKEEVEAKLKEARKRLARYESYQKLMEETGALQLSLTDADAKLMKNKTDSAYLIIRRETEGEILEVKADKGYEDGDDMVKCLENGIIPHVITEDGKEGYELEISYEEAEADAESTDAEELKKCLHAGIIPEAYKEVISEIKVEEVCCKVKENASQETGKAESRYGTPEEMKEHAEAGYFVRDPERNLVYCPAGEILRQKCIKKNGYIRYANKNACRHCKNKNKCYKGKGEWKAI